MIQPMKRVLPVTLLILGCSMQLSCTQWMQQQKPESECKNEAMPDIPPPLYLGAVHQVFPSDQFALLRIIGPVPEEGTVLITHPADGSTERVGNLIVSSAQHARGNIIAADIRAGEVMKGDRVFRYRSIAAAPVEEEEPEPFTMTDTEIDMGYTPPAIKEQLMEEQASITTAPQAEPAEISEPAPAYETPPQVHEQAPLPETPAGEGKFDDIPDTISGWDSM